MGSEQRTFQLEIIWPLLNLLKECIDPTLVRIFSSACVMAMTPTGSAIKDAFVNINWKIIDAAMSNQKSRGGVL